MLSLVNALSAKPNGSPWDCLFSVYALATKNSAFIVTVDQDIYIPDWV